MDGEVLRRLIRAAGGNGVKVRDLAGRPGTATAVRRGLAVIAYPDGVERLDPTLLTWAGVPDAVSASPTSRQTDTPRRLMPAAASTPVGSSRLRGEGPPR